MNKSKHTRGPWFLTKGDGRQRGYIRTTPKTPVAGVPSICKVTYSRYEWEANARLIAEAPILLELLTEVKEAYQRNPHHIADGINWARWFNDCVGTIARATSGGQS